MQVEGGRGAEAPAGVDPGQPAIQALPEGQGGLDAAEAGAQKARAQQTWLRR